MNHDLNQIKQDYQNISVPEALKPKVTDAIAKAKADMANADGGNSRKTALPFHFPFAKTAWAAPQPPLHLPPPGLPPLPLPLSSSPTPAPPFPMPWSRFQSLAP